MRFVERFLQIAAQNESRAAVEAGDTSITYGALRSRAAAVAAGLRDRDAIVPLQHGRSIDQIAGILGCWMAGAAFAPIDPQLPEARKQCMRAELASARGDGLAYCIFTSGTTGVPKGVLIEHANLVPLFEAQIDAFRLRPGSRALWYLSPGFDASLSDIGTALLAGATLVLPPREGLHGESLAAALGALRITHADLPPSILPRLPETDLETLIVGGERCAPEAVRRHARRTRVVNAYGPTETTICASLCACGEDWDRALLGKPIAGARFRAVDGELWIGGPGLARGYLNRPELSADRFITEDGERWYRTGDRVREWPGGELEFLGRVDRQLKLRSVRVEPEEIEAQLARAPGVRAAAVALRDGQLAAFVEPAVALEPVRAHAVAHLPQALVPQRFAALDALPRTAAGKIDFAGLPDSPRDDSLPEGLPAPRLQRLFAAALGGARVGASDDFFALGGSSLHALQLAAAAEAEGLRITLRELLRWPTPAALAQHLGTSDALPAAQLRADAESLIDPSLRCAAHYAGPPRRILLTGATGFLGRRLAEALRPHAELVCPGRADLDLTKPRLGLSDARWNELALSIDTIVHCAAEVDILKEYCELRAANLSGTAALLRLAAAGAPKAFHYISTLAVFAGGDRNRGELREDDELRDVRALYGGYAQTKFAAEHLVRAARPSAAIDRLGLLTSREPRGDLLSICMAALRKLRCLPESADGALAFDVTPVGFAAAALAHFVATGVQSATLHVANDSAMTLDQLARELQLARVPDAEFAGRAREVAGGELLAAALARRRPADLFAATGARFSTEKCKAALAGSGLRCPPPSLELLP